MGEILAVVNIPTTDGLIVDVLRHPRSVTPRSAEAERELRRVAPAKQGPWQPGNRSPAGCAKRKTRSLLECSTQTRFDPNIALR